MTRRPDLCSFERAWAAFDAANSSERGWRTIPVKAAGLCRVLAGRHFPGNLEALLVGFPTVTLPAAGMLPAGAGFVVLPLPTAPPGEHGSWLALRREKGGNLELFGEMATDLVRVLESPGVGEAALLMQFLGRIRAWQEFMRQAGTGVLSGEAEVGLVGELEVLSQLLEENLPGDFCLEAWEGPEGGLQDFALGLGAIEVKSSLAATSFPAQVGSLEQLDDSKVQPLFVAALRLRQVATGRTLPEVVADLRDVLTVNLVEFESKLLAAGYREEFSGKYERRFERVQLRVLRVTEGFPRLTRGGVALAIRTARYELDLDQVAAGDIGLRAALEELGVKQPWN